ncbi:alkanesulfonate monooxygenase SsuD/methylene tetrahydromethanopterin reductase-like flavin-dependent oxidoreductase (luciferase family) [Nocardia sp. GAS34]|uniref:hypothetical protein n=1 Tax=unclassified Nocardia TaxID=2637762 RepID=UPI003D1C992A
MPEIPVMIAGSGDRVLTLAAHHARIVGFTGGKSGSIAPDPLAERVDFVRNAAGDRFGQLQLNLTITAVLATTAASPICG